MNGPGPAGPARPRLGDGARHRPGRPPGRAERPDDLGARSAEVRRRRRPPAVPGPDGRSLRGHRRRAEPVRHAGPRPGRASASSDLRRLLDSEELHDVQILVTSATTGAGISALRRVLAETVSARRAAAARITADVDAVVARFLPYAGQDPPVDAARPGRPRPHRRPMPDPAPLAAAAAGPWTAGPPPPSWPPRRAASPPPSPRPPGVSAIGDALQSARELRAVDFIGWPVSWLFERLVQARPGTQDPARTPVGRAARGHRRAVRSPASRDRQRPDRARRRGQPRACPGPGPRPSGPPSAPVPMTSPVLSASASTRPSPPRTRSRPGGAPSASGRACCSAASIVGIAWIVAIVIFGVFKVGSGVPSLFRDGRPAAPHRAADRGVAGARLAHRLHVRQRGPQRRHPREGAGRGASCRPGWPASRSRLVVAPPSWSCPSWTAFAPSCASPWATPASPSDRLRP